MFCSIFSYLCIPVTAGSFKKCVVYQNLCYFFPVWVFTINRLWAETWDSFNQWKESMMLIILFFAVSITCKQCTTFLTCLLRKLLHISVKVCLVLTSLTPSGITDHFWSGRSHKAALFKSPCSQLYRERYSACWGKKFGCLFHDTEFHCEGSKLYWYRHSI